MSLVQGAHGSGVGGPPEEATGLVGSDSPVTSWAHWVRVPELLVGLSLPFWRYEVVPGLPTDVAVFALVVAGASFARPTRRNSAVPWVALLYFTMLVSVVVVSLAMGQPWLQRSFRLMLLFAFVAVVAQGRLHLKSILLGGVLSLFVLNTLAFYLGLTPNRYPPFLTGWLGDKNVAGMYYAVMAVLGLSLIRTSWRQGAFFVVALSLLWLTGSRTSIAAAVAGLVWWLIRNRLGLVGRLTAFASGIWILQWFEERYSQVGAFADREGTDLLRSAIHEAERAKIAGSAWYGRGFNTAWVDVMGFRHMWFHDSYAALRVEGGVPMLVTMLLIFCVVALGLLSVKRLVGGRLRAAEGAIIVILVCAWQLGEVFFSSLAFFVMGVAVYERFGRARNDGRGLGRE